MKVYSGPRISSSVLSLSNVLIFLSTILTFECGKFLIIMAWGWRYFTVISSPVIQKSGGAWMGNFVEQSTLNETHPVIYNVCNYQKPAAGEPALLLWDDVITLFHEFGHTLHGLFARQRYATLSGTNTPRDFVEFPSQINEHWATHPQVFARYARHYQSGAAMPDELQQKMRNASLFNKGYEMSEL